MTPKVQDTKLLRIRYRLYRLRNRNRAAMSYAMYRQCLWLGRHG